MTEDDITRFCGVLGSLGGGKDPLVEELESRWEDLETQLKKYTEHLTMMESQLKKSGSKLLGTLKRLDTERSADTRYANQSCQFVRNKIRERATVPMTAVKTCADILGDKIIDDGGEEEEEGEENEDEESESS